MLKIAFLLALVTVGAKAEYVTPTDLAANVTQAIKDFQKLISDGVYVKPPGFDEIVLENIVYGSNVLNAGIVTLPLAFLCNQTGVLLNLICRIGVIDCIYVHNKYSGQCALSPNPVPNTAQTLGKVFVCNDQQPTGYNYTQVSDPNNCGPLLGPDLDPVLDRTLQSSTRLRFVTDLCQNAGDINFSSVGCASDCRNNHQYANGTCATNVTPIARYQGEYNPGFQCLCSY